MKLIPKEQSMKLRKKKSASEEYAELPWYAQAAQAADDTVRFLANGMTLGYADKLAGYMGGEGTEAERIKTDRARQRAGSAATAADIVGSMMPASAVARGAGALGLAGRGVAGRTASMGAQGAILGAGQALGNDQDLAMGAGVGLASGVGGNLLGEGISAGASKLAGMFNAKPSTMTQEQLKSAGQDAYARAKSSGVIFKPEAVDRLRGQVYDDFAEFGFHPANQPGAAVAYDELTRLSQGGNVDLQGLDTARKVASGGFRPQNPSNNSLVGTVTERIDDFAANAGPDDILSGDPQAASAALKEARDYWSRFRKMEKVDELLDRAGLQAGSTGSGGNVENATRQQLKRILTDKKMMRGFKPDELDALKKAVLGTKTQNALRLAGKLSPQGNGLMTALGLGGAAAVPAVAIPAMIGGTIAKKGAEAMTYRNAEMVKRIIAAGGSKAALEGPKNAVQRLSDAKRDDIARLLMMGILGTARQQ